ncbi:host specificity protein [Rhodobacterales bacterium 52_120_T64]|nr:host specificity protein [Rhodobacterales bacterium 52_120_T64]
MATLVLSAIGGAIGASMGGAAFGLSSMVIGRAIGATAGRLLDGQLMGGSAPVERGQVENFRVLGAREGAKIPRVYGAMRISGQIIWSTRFMEHVDSSGGGKGTSTPVVNEYSYSISLAIALCEGEITRIGKVWADGKEISLEGIDYRLYCGDLAQMPDAAIVAVEGEELTPAYRGTAYIVLENLDLTRFGNRIPQFGFEVVRKPEPLPDGEPRDAAELVQAVALVPGTGEYALATKPVSYPHGKGIARSANINGIGEGTDFVRSLKHLDEDLPNAESMSLVVSWFGDDLRCNSCTLQPAVEQVEIDGDTMPWMVSGQARAGAKVVGQIDERSAFGGTPADAAVMQAIKHIQDQGKGVMFYPFILMDILDGNALTNPWTGDVGQPSVPWRGRITTSAAPGLFGSPDQSSAAAMQVSDFFGTAGVEDFEQGADGVSYTGPNEWSYRRFVLHYAHLCVAAGGVEAFCIGSEMRSLTQVRDGLNSFPTVVQLVQLAADCRAILGPDCKIGYAADWSEYFGYQPASGDVFYHLDPLWADDNIDFIGIDNYMPISDWRDSVEHLDDAYSSIYDLEYLQENIEGGEGFDWYYASGQARTDQIRSPIVDGVHGEDWVYRYKDIRSWWSEQHHERIGGVRQVEGTDWLPETKPIWFTEIGCPAVDKASNQPNVFDDVKSSESARPYFSNGNRDDLIQHRYLQAILSYWSDEANNPEASQYDGRMIDVSHTHVWAWDARPFPDFPERVDVWSDSGAFQRGHWVSGRVHMASLANVVAEVCRRAGLGAVDVSQLYGLVRGFIIGDTESARQSLQPLMLAYGFDCFERNGVLVFRNRDGRSIENLDASRFVEEGEGAYSLTRNSDAETVGRVRVEFVDADNAYQMAAAEHVFPDESEAHTSQSSLPLALTVGEGQGIVERWLSEARIARDRVSLAVAPSVAAVGVGDVVTVLGSDYRIDRVEEAGARRLSGVRVETGVYAPKLHDFAANGPAAPVIYGPVYAELMDLPLLGGTEVEHAFHVAVSGDPWPGRVAVYSAGADYGYRLNTTLGRSAVVGELVSPLLAGRAGLWQRSTVRVKVASGYLASMPEMDVLNGANRAALRDSGGNWEVFQFCNAELVADREYLLTKLLRGQAGTEFLVPDLWGVGTDFVLLNGAVSQVDLAAAERGLDRHYRIGAAHLPLDDDSYVHAVFAGRGVGLRPYAPVHLRAVVDGDVDVSWIRRTRIEGDVWQNYEVPLGEDREAYLVRVSSAGTLLREVEVLNAEFIYTTAMQVDDGSGGVIEFEVAQISDRFGVGPFIKETVNV